MARRRSVKVKVVWIDGSKEEFEAEDKGSITQRYRQLNILTPHGETIAINMQNTRFVQIDSDDIDFNDINNT